VFKPDDYERLVREQIAYYQARASEYDQWFLRQGRYDRGEILNQRWFQEVGIVRQALDAFRPAGQVLELARGTGLWTRQLLRYADTITAVDAVAEVLAINRDRLRSPRVHYAQADVFSWTPAAQYDVIFFGFWLSHVPPGRFEAFWQRLVMALSPAGRVFFVDSRYDPTSTATNHRLEGRQSTAIIRRLNDDREFRIVKLFYEIGPLTARLAKLGWQASLAETDHYFLYGSVQRDT